MNVVEFPIDVALTNVPGRLRKLADDIEAGKQPARIAIVVLVDNQDNTALLGYGEIGQSVEALGWIVRAMRDV